MQQIFKMSKQDSKGFCGSFEPSKCVGSNEQRFMDEPLAKTPAWNSETWMLRSGRRVLPLLERSPEKPRKGAFFVKLRQNIQVRDG
jgi:hypothetical protein